MEDIKIKLAVLWIALMLVYLLGDVLRIYSGDFKPGEIAGKKITEAMMLGIAAVMIIPIIMSFLSISLDHNINRVVNIILAIFLLLFNLVGLPSYKGKYDKFLIIVGLIINVMTIWYALTWV